MASSGAEDRVVVTSAHGGWNWSSQAIRPGEPLPFKDENDVIAADVSFHRACPSPNGATLALAVRGAILLQGPHINYPVRWLRDGLAESAHADTVAGLSIDRTSTLLASGGADNHIKIWDLTTGQLLLRVFLPGDEGVIPVFDPVADELLIATNRKLTRYRVNRPRTVRVTESQKGPVGALAFVDNERVASVMWQKHPVRLVGHAIPQVHYDGDWHVMDGDLGMIYLLRDNETLANDRQLARDHDLVKRTHTMGILVDDSRMRDERAAAMFVSEEPIQGAGRARRTRP